MKLEDLEAKLGIANMGEEEKLALVKDIQANIPALKAEQRVLEAKTQANLVVEAIKKIKEGLEARFDELNGIVDVKVRDITSGKDGLQGPKGDQGDRGFDGTNGKDGYNGKDGIDGVDGKDGVGVRDAYIDFDGSLIIKLTDGTEINVGEVVPMDVAEKIKVIGNGGGTSQSVLDALDSLTLATTTSAAITGGTIDGTPIGATTPAAGTFTTLTATGESLLGLNGSNNQTFRAIAGTGAFPWVQTSHASGNARLRAVPTSGAADFYLSSTGSGAVRFWSNAFTDEQFRISNTTSAVNYVQVTGAASGSQPKIQSAGNSIALGISGNGANGVSFWSNSFATQQFNVAHTASAVNYVQVTGSATTLFPNISAQGSDTNIGLTFASKGSQAIRFNTNTSDQQFRVTHTASAVNYVQVTGNIAGSSPRVLAEGSDTNIDLTLTPKGTGNVRFGTYTANMALTIQGYIEIKDSGGTTRRLAVIA
jgi:hypothetical protein